MGTAAAPVGGDSDANAYLRNIVYQYMMDIHTGDVAHVIAAMLEFTPEQKREVQAHEADKKGWLSGFVTQLPSQFRDFRLPSFNALGGQPDGESQDSSASS